MATLEEMAREKFLPLSEAEERVVRAAPEGMIADCSDLGGGHEPEKADGSPKALDEKWPDARNVRADLIRWLCVDREAREQVDPRGVWIRGARITGALDLSFTNVPFPLLLLSCRLEQDLRLGYAKMPVLSLEGSWTGAIGADGLKLEGDILLRNGFHAEGEVRLLGAAIGGDLNAEGGTFKNLKSDKNPNPTGRALTADGINVTGGVCLRNGFSAEGQVRLLGATIGGNLDATDGTFKKPSGNALNPDGTKNETALNADGIKVTGDIFLRKAFSAEGEVRLLGATIGGNLEATGGTFKNQNGNALIADRIEVHGNVFLRNAFHAEGAVRLVGAEITGQLEVDDAWLDSLDLESAHIAGPFFWRNIHKDPHPDFPNKEWKPSLDVTYAKLGPLADQEASWPEKGGLRLDGFVYDRIAEGPTDATARLRWLRLQPDWLGYRPQPYEQLIAVLRRMGHEHHVAEVAIAKQKDLYEHGDLDRWGKFWNRFRYRVIGCGYKPWWAFGWMAALVFAGTLVFLLARLLPAPVMVPSDKEAYQSDQKTELATPPHYYPQFNALVYSLDVIIPFDLGQKSHWRLHERGPWDFLYWIFEGYSLFQLIAGWVLLLVAAAVPARFIKKD
jgi:hypothetical protein